MAYNYKRISQLPTALTSNISTDRMVILTNPTTDPVLQTISTVNLANSLNLYLNSNPSLSSLTVANNNIPATLYANGNGLYVTNSYFTSISVNTSFVANTSGITVSNASLQNLYVNNSLTVNTFTNSYLVVNSSGTYTNTIYVANDLFVTGNVTVSGCTTFINSTVITTKDRYMIFSNGAASALSADGSGIVIATYANLVYDNVTNSWQSNVDITPIANNLNLGNTSGYVWNVFANNVNAVSYTVGTTFVANTTTLNANGLVVNSTGAYVTGLVNAASYTVGTNFIANTLGVYTTGTVNAVSLAVGSNVVANTTGLFTLGEPIQASNGLYSVGQYNGTYSDGIVVDYITTNGRISVGTADSLSFYTGGVGATLMLTTNTTGVYVPTLVNAAAHTVGTSFIANTSTLFIANTVGVNANGSLGGSGQVLTSNGSTVYWSTVSGGSGSVNTAAQYTFTNTITFSNTITIANVSANGTTGTSGQYLTSDGTKAYWSTPGAVSVNVAAQYAWTNTQSFSNTITFTGSILANTINATSYTVGSNVVANNTGVYVAGIVNSATISTGSQFISNSTGLFVYSLINLTNGNGSAGQVLTSNGSGNVYWSTAASAMALTANNTDTATYYFPMSNSSSGSWTNGVISNTSLYFVPATGTLSATVFNSLSDKTQKTNVQTISNPTEKLKNLRGVEFDWVSDNRKSAGVIAQEVEQVLPHLVEQNFELKSVNYSGLIAYLIETIKEMNSEMDELKSRISNLEKTL